MKHLPFLLLIFWFISCSDQPTQLPPSSDSLIDQLISDRFASVIDVDDVLVVRFREGIPLNTETGFDNFRLTPRTKGSFRWLDERTLHYKPDVSFAYNQSYALTLPLVGLIDSLPGNEDKLIFNFKTVPLEVVLSSAVPQLSVANGEVNVTINGLVRTNQYADPGYVEDLLSVSGSSKSLPAEWSHEEKGKVHRFVLSGIQQTDQEQTLTLSLKKGRLHTSAHDDRLNISIRPSDQFAIEDIYVRQSPSRVIHCIFSLPLDQDQDLRGIIRINDQNENLRTLIEGNELRIFIDGLSDERVTLEIDESIRAFNSNRLATAHSETLHLEPIKPQLRLGSQGVLVPAVSNVTFPFEAINLDTVDVEIFKIYEQNVLQFMQDNVLSGSYNLREVGRIVHREKLAISGPGSAMNSWQSVGLEMGDYIENDPGAIYQVRVGFQPSYITIECDEAIEGYVPPSENESILDYRYYSYSRWNDPCSPSYYNADQFIKRNVIYSNLAAIIKRVAENQFYISTQKISDGSTIAGADISFFNFQKIELGSIRTNSDGFAEIKLEEKPSFATASHPEGTTYINLQDGAVKSISDFETSGTNAGNGVNAFMYSERGVYRPGDTIHMNVIVELENADIPGDHPVHLTLKDPQGQLKFRETANEHLDHIYSFTIPTDVQDITGSWLASFTIGNFTVTKRIPVETIKPNRLRLELEMDEVISYSNQSSRAINITSSWLHGAPAANLRAQVDVVWTSRVPDFDRFANFKFTDPARPLNNRRGTLFDGSLDEEGHQTFTLKLDQEARFPAWLNGNVTSRVFEKGGSFSENYSSIQVSPYSHYTGMVVPKNEWGYASVQIGEEATFNAVSVSENGQPASGRKLTVGIYDINWRWWYYRGQRFRIYELNSDQHTEATWKKEVVTGDNGTASISFDASDLEYGRKMIRICDPESGHCTGDFFYASSWSSSVSEEERNSLSRLHFTSDKTKYSVGENVTLSIPSEDGSRIFVSLEGGNEIITQEWIDGKPGVTNFSFDVAPEMAPNIYAHVSLVQPYGQVGNDLPIRMYGVIPIMVEDPETRLYPQLEVPSEFKPNEGFTVGVSEENELPMTYTLAIVDEGLLDLTNFNTPDPHSHFYAKKALGTKTWDVYDDILYGLQNQTDKIISIGGDGSESGDSGSKKAIRFAPVVFTAGPYRLKPGEKREHAFNMPDYVGSVRAMVIARHEASFGKSEVAVPVKSPLMVVPTLPRVLSQGEEIMLPVTVFAMEDFINDVEVSVKASPLVTINQDQKNLRFEQVGEQTTAFKIDIADRPGIANFNVTASSGSNNANKQIEIDVRNPNPVRTNVTSAILEPGKSWESLVEPFGVQGTNGATVELSHLPPLNLASRMDYLIRYPYGCVEQTTSAAFVQLYLGDISDYVAQAALDRNIRAGINRIIKLQHRNGGFKYWPSSRSKVHEWASSYAGHFLMEARDKGYYVPNSVLNKWTEDQKKRADRFAIGTGTSNYGRRQAMLNQAYRLYTLSMAGSPNLSAMNLLRGYPDLPSTARYLLAAAYARASKQNLALDLITNAKTEVAPYRDLGYTFGSEVRDLALIAQSLFFLDRKSQSLEIVRRIANQLNSERWYSTQSVALGLLAVGKFANDFKDSQIKASLRSEVIGEQNISYDKPIFTFTFNPEEATNKSLSIVNNGEKSLFATIQLKGQASPASMLNEKAINDHVQLSVVYKNMNGDPIDISNLEQGTDFLAEVEIRNLNTRGTTIDEMALTQIVPGGWEIRSGRLNTNSGITQDVYDYRDVRDDRVHTFFDLNKRKKFVIQLNAAYAGNYYLPPVKVEAMYDKDVSAYTAPRMVRVRQSGFN